MKEAGLDGGPGRCEDPSQMPAAIFQFPYRTVAEVSLGSLIHNLFVLRTLSRREVIPVIKANAYGHGMLPVARALVHRGSCQVLAVATLEEGIELRRRVAGIEVLVLSGFFPHQLDAYVKYRLTPVIHSLVHLKSLAGHPRLPEIHLKVDTGMHRLGIAEGEIGEAMRTLDRLKIKLAGLATHFADSEALISDFVDTQLSAFAGFESALRERRLLQTDARIHVGNSAAVLRDKLGDSVAVRPGLALYGISPNPRLPRSSDLLPVLRWKSRVLSLKAVLKGDSVGYCRTYVARRRERLGIVPVGYADGYPRGAGNRGHVLVAGRRASIRGIVSMDMMAVDCTAGSVREGSEVVLIGQSGKERVGVEQVAAWSETIPYEILCRISERVPRIYFE